MEDFRDFFRRVARAVLTVISMGEGIAWFVAMIVGALLREWFVRDKSLRDAAAETPGMKRAALIRGERSADYQVWLHEIETTIRRRRHGKRRGRLTGPVLKSIDSPKHEDPAA